MPQQAAPYSLASTPAASPDVVDASFQMYSQDFDKLSTEAKCLAIGRLLDTLPTVNEMRHYLEKRHSASLQGWTERISPSAVSLLRWIIASNRACIMQVDGNAPPEGESAATASRAPSVFGKTHERCHGMKGYMQFRFAMGAPDKEQRFITEVRKTTTRLSLIHPTIFAWHGSSLANWHMIIREGLHYNNVANGRAHGDGVYHARDATTSTGYCKPGKHGGAGVRGVWPSSILNISSALALNEIVNAPKEFQANTPYYVVKQLDWIQTRYLFVQVNPKTDDVMIGPEVSPLRSFTMLKPITATSSRKDTFKQHHGFEETCLHLLGRPQARSPSGSCSYPARYICD